MTSNWTWNLAGSFFYLVQRGVDKGKIHCAIVSHSFFNEVTAYSIIDWTMHRDARLPAMEALNRQVTSSRRDRQEDALNEEWSPDYGRDQT